MKPEYQKPVIIFGGGAVLVALIAAVFYVTVIVPSNQEKLNTEAPAQSEAVSESTKTLLKQGFMEGCDTDGTLTAYCGCAGDALVKDMDYNRLNQVIALQGEENEAKLIDFITPFAAQCNGLAQ